MSHTLEQGLAKVHPARKAEADAADLRMAHQRAQFAAAIRSERADTIYAQCISRASHMGAVSYPEVCRHMDVAIRALCDKLNTLDGTNAIPSERGGFFVLCPFGPASVLVEFDGDGGNHEVTVAACLSSHALALCLALWM